MTLYVCGNGEKDSNDKYLFFGCRKCSNRSPFIENFDFLGGGTLKKDLILFIFHNNLFE